MGGTGIEPVTPCVSSKCSTAELTAHKGNCGNVGASHSGPFRPFQALIRQILRITGIPHGKGGAMLYNRFMPRFLTTAIPSPVGSLGLVSTDDALIAILWENDRAGRVTLPQAMDDAPDHPLLIETARQLNAYFAGRLRSFSLPLAFRGTEFQKKVWNALLTIPYGETRSYSAIAMQIGCPGASRAVGAANGRNPISIVAPCHRVVGANGCLTGFAGGMEAKSTLLRLESPQFSLAA